MTVLPIFLTRVARLSLPALLIAAAGCGGHAASVDAGTRGDAHGDAVRDAAVEAPSLEASSDPVADAVARVDASGDADAGSRDAEVDTVDAADAAVVCGFVMPNPASTGLPHRSLYDTSAAGIVTDEVTGLEWQKTSGGATFQRAQAGPHCQALTLGGFSDWRLPSVVELVSILDVTAAQSLDAVAFAGETNDLYWTSSRTPTGVGWTVAFGSHAETTFVVSPGDFFKVRCVRNGLTPPLRCVGASARYQPRANGLVFDALTDLTWQSDGAATMPLDWNAAQAHCAGLLDGFRLPSLRELETIVDYDVVEPALDPIAFPNLPLSSEGPIQPNVTKSYFWTSSPVQGATGNAWVVDFWTGQTFAPTLAALQHVRCVR